METKIILISGKAEHGKSTLGTMLQNSLIKQGEKVLRIGFADQVKFIASKYHKWNGEKDEDGRSLLQWVASYVRERDEDFWARIVFEFVTVFQEQYSYVIIDDWRFINEEVIFRFSPFETFSVRVVRLDFENSLTEEQRSHCSEVELDNHHFDYTVYNTDLESLQSLANRLCSDFRKEENKNPFAVLSYISPLLDVQELSNEGTCWNCGRKTNWVDLSFEAYLCSPHCVHRKSQQFWFDYENSIIRDLNA